jgi:hypothetical protein
MTDKEKLQQLFDAALKSSPLDTTKPLKRAFSEPATPSAPVSKGDPTPIVEAPAIEMAPEAPDASPAVGGLDKAAADDLGAMLDKKVRKMARKRRIEVWVTAIVVIGSISGGFGWFVRSPTRVEAFTAALREIRSISDVKSLAARYQKALDRTAARGRQIDQAAAAMGVNVSAEDDKKAGMDDEIQKMMGGDGKTSDQRDQKLREKFGDKANEHGGVLKSSGAQEGEDSFKY